MRGKAFLKWTRSIDLSSKLSLTYRGNVNYYKSVQHPIPTLPGGNREHPGNFQNKSVNSLFNWASRYILFLPKLKGKERPFLEGCKKEDHIARLSPRALGWCKRWKSLFFCKIWNNLTPPLFFIRPIKNEYCRTWGSMINLWMDSRNCQR